MRDDIKSPLKWLQVITAVCLFPDPSPDAEVVCIFTVLDRELVEAADLLC